MGLSVTPTYVCMFSCPFDPIDGTSMLQRPFSGLAVFPLLEHPAFLLGVGQLVKILFYSRCTAKRNSQSLPIEYFTKYNMYGGSVYQLN